jgi:hypothetical protein
MLTQIVADQSSGPPVLAGATATLIDLLVKDGKADEASGQLERSRGSLPVDDYLRLRRAIAARWGQVGEVNRAEALLAGDSTVEALALLGRFRLYAGDLQGVSELWKAAGPFAGTREEATERSVILALIQPVAPDTLVPLGQAFQLLDGGDSVAAAKGFERIGRDLPAVGGRPRRHGTSRPRRPRRDWPPASRWRPPVRRSSAAGLPPSASCCSSSPAPQRRSRCRP